MLWFTSDLHWNHRNVLPYCNRPYGSVEEMNEAMLKIWNDTVKPDDTVWFLGDLDINGKRSHRDLVKSLNGHKKLIVGNHDIGFSHTHSGSRVLDKTQRQRDQLLEYGWQEVHQIHTVTLKNGRNVMLSHLPYLEDTSEFDLRYKELRPIDKGMTLIHGHLHARYIKKNRMIDVAFDGKLGFYSEDEVIALIDDPRDYISSRLTDFYNSSNPRVLEK